MTVALIKDINSIVSGVREITDVDGRAFFIEGSFANGVLMVADGTPLGVNQLRSSPTYTAPYTFPSDLTALGSKLIFVANDLTHGVGLWRSDGTVAGTVFVKAPNPAGGGKPENLTTVGSTLYFTANDGVHGDELWKTDGTAEGTMLLRDLLPGQAGSSPEDLTAVGSTLYFTAVDGQGDRQLWKSDGTAAGTVVVDAAALAGMTPQNLTAVGSTLDFTFGNGPFQTTVWTTDGTDAGTTPLTSFTSTGPENVQLDNFTAVGSELFFAREDINSIPELWKSDGSPAGTVRVVSLTGAGNYQRTADFTAVGSTLFFTLTNASGINELYKSDGTADGTSVVRDLHRVGLDYSSRLDEPPRFASLDGFLYFADNDPAEGAEVFKTDGTSVSLLGGDDPGPQGIGPRDLTKVGDHLDFFARNSYETLFFQSDASGANIQAAIVPFSSSTEPSSPNGLLLDSGTRAATFGDSVLFTANDGLHNIQLWKTDGTPGGTQVVKDINPNGWLDMVDPVMLGRVLYFGVADTTDGSQSGLWRTDGTEAGTYEVASFPSGIPGGTNVTLAPEHLAAADGVLYFERNSPSGLIELWKSDGTAAGTVLVTSIVPQGSPWFGDFEAAGSTVFFAVDDGSGGTNLWRSDGTAAGTFVLKDFAQAFDTYNSPFQFTALGSAMTFVVDAGGTGRELWRSDGTIAGTTMVKDINPGPQGSDPNALTAIGSTLYFTADDGTHGTELWKSDGTASGTVLVKDINPGAGSSSPDSATGNGFTQVGFASLGSSIYFYADDGSNSGVEIWRSDGTAAGTTLVKTLNRHAPGGSNNYHTQFQPIGAYLYFEAGDRNLGLGLYRTDGTASGTVRVANYGGTPTTVTIQPIAAVPLGLVAVVDIPEGDTEPYLITGTVSNLSPTVHPVADQFVALHGTLTIPVTATDPDAGQTLTYSLDPDVPAGTTINSTTGVVTFKPKSPGTYYILVRATDNGSPAQSDTTMITVHVRGTVADDFDGDGKSDLAVYRPGQALWIINKSSGGITFTNFGDPRAGDLAAPGDYDGDGKTDLAVYRPSQALWIINESTGGLVITQMGDPKAGDIAAPGDYDGDGKTDLAVYRRDAGLWIISKSSGGVLVAQMGDPKQVDIAAPGDYDGDGRTDLAVYRPSQALWIIRKSSGGTTVTNFGDKNAGDFAAPGDYDGDGKTDLAVYRPSQALWIIAYSGGGMLVTNFGDAKANDRAVEMSPYAQGMVIGHIFSGASSARGSYDLSSVSNGANVMKTSSVHVPRPSRVMAAYKARSTSIAIQGTNS